MRDRRFKWWWLLVIPPAMVLFGWLFGEIVMHLWNWLMPALFGLKLITFWQAIGLLILARILVGGLGGGQTNNRRKHSGARWERMTPEEHEKFREWMRTRHGGPMPSTETQLPAS
jgi:hypothetical protein